MSGEESFMLQDARERVKKNPESFDSHALLGELLYQAKRYSEAIEPLEKGALLLKSEFDKNPARIGMFSIEMAEKVLLSLYMMRGP